MLVVGLFYWYIINRTFIYDDD